MAKKQERKKQESVWYVEWQDISTLDFIKSIQDHLESQVRNFGGKSVALVKCSFQTVLILHRAKDFLKFRIFSEKSGKLRLAPEFIWQSKERRTA